MCRHLAYVGPPVALGALLTDPDHSLVAQARDARYQASGCENPDGWGVGWFDDAGHPQRHRTPTPIWADPELADLARTVHSGDVLAAVRLASPGSPVEESGNAPFVADGRWLFSLNGIVDGYHEGVGDELRALVSEHRRAGIDGESDSEVLFALLLDELDAGCPPADALAAVIRTVEARTTGRLNMLLSERAAAAATAVGNSLFCRGASLVASEPLDGSPEWEPVADRTVLTTDGAHLVVASL
jgi:gamma-glutamyl hercynylcysteine S-oxide hydrolase